MGTKEQITKNIKSGIVKDNYQIKLDDGHWIDLDPTMQLNPAFDVRKGDKVTIVILKGLFEYDALIDKLKEKRL